MASPRPAPIRLSAAAGLVILLLASGSLAGCLGIERTEWAFDATQISDVQDRGLTGRGIVIGIVDSGIDPTHPSLDHVPIVNWQDYLNGRERPYDDYGHGTHVAGIIAASGGTKEFLSGADLDGVAPRVSLIVVKACGEETCSSDAVARGIDFTVRNGADIVVLSLGGQQVVLNLGDAPLEAVDRAARAGVYVVAAAGNRGTDHGDVESPSSASGAIAVGAIDSKRNVADFSSRGSRAKNQGTALPTGCLDCREDPNKKPELVAPGVNILSTWTDGTYARATGTSQAAPFVAGALALLLEENPAWRTIGSKGGCRAAVDQMKTVLTESAQKLPGQTLPHDVAAGYGLLQAEAARKRLAAVTTDPC